MDVRPNTKEDFLALPEGPEIDIKIDGDVRIPVMRATCAVFNEATDIIYATDDTGVAWQIGLYQDGTWFKRRV